MTIRPLSEQHYARLDWITPDSAAVIARHARVSTKEPDRPEFSRLLSYCIREGHVSPFEQACACFEIITTRSISPQILRHRSFCFQETSQRYCDPNKVLESLSPSAAHFELRKQDTKNRQNSLDFDGNAVEEKYRARIEGVCVASQAIYDDMLADGVAKECARNILPMNTPTRLHMQGNIRNWIFYVGLRAKPGTQKEHRLIASEVGRILRQQVPKIILAVQAAAFEDSSLGLDGWKFIDSL